VGALSHIGFAAAQSDHWVSANPWLARLNLSVFGNV